MLTIAMRGYRLTQRQLDAITPILNKSLRGKKTREDNYLKVLYDAGCPLESGAEMTGIKDPLGCPVCVGDYISIKGQRAIVQKVRRGHQDLFVARKENDDKYYPLVGKYEIIARAL